MAIRQRKCSGGWASDRIRSPSPRRYPAPPALQPFDLHEAKTAPRPSKRKEIEARRFNGKESVVDYLRQFELTAKRNQWDDSDKASALLCALDGPARSILSEIDDMDDISYTEVKQLLQRRFGPVSHTEVHEQALRDLRLARGQHIRDLSTEVTRLTKLAYPDFDKKARGHLATNALINAIGEKDTIFYIKDKNPINAEEVCSLYERYKVLTGCSMKQKPATVQGVKPEENALTVATASENDGILASLVKQNETGQQQVQQLADTVAMLVQHHTAPVPAAPPARACVPQNMHSNTLLSQTPQLSHANRYGQPRTVLHLGLAPVAKTPATGCATALDSVRENGVEPLTAPGPRSFQHHRPQSQ